MIITGSNMAGKSTYLKSVATNLLLSSTGGPVCANDFRWTPISLYSDINVRDSLDDGKSYFQVEVERVHDVIQSARSSPMVLAIFAFSITTSLDAFNYQMYRKFLAMRHSRNERSKDRPKRGDQYK